MKLSIFGFISMLVCCSAGQSQDLKNVSNAEPRSTFELNINGKKYIVSEDEELKLDTLISKPVISVKMSKYKKFNNAYVSFDYPRNLSYEFDEDAGYRNWTLSGNSFIILVFEIDGETTLASLLNRMVEKFGKENCTIENYQKELGKRKWNVEKLHVSIAGQKLILECFDIKLSDTKSRFIYFQDTLEDGRNSTEYEDGFKMVDSTISFK